MPSVRQKLFFSLSRLSSTFSEGCWKNYQRRRGKGTESGDFQSTLWKFLKQKIVLCVNPKR